MIRGLWWLATLTVLGMVLAAICLWQHHSAAALFSVIMAWINAWHLDVELRGEGVS